MNLTDLSDAGRAYLLAHVRNDRTRAEALAEIVFLDAGISPTARQFGLNPGALRRQSQALRKDMRVAIKLLGVDLFVRKDGGDA